MSDFGAYKPDDSVFGDDVVDLAVQLVDLPVKHHRTPAA